ncbi:zinc ribbon domain-containing protein [Pseudonocardia sp. NPDC046786]|uniref:FmdB family zinc ribbon protein n=1 Tax=Pseudonocardia sp. NPDC046786 TaxID=3155471 RepID=UPI0033F6AFB6
MATYTYRCATDGPVDVRRPIGTAPATLACPACGAEAVRLITPPMLGIADRGRMGLIDRAEASRTEPQVVTSLPSAAGAPRPNARIDPRTRGLPRP